jgi:uncharacterized SAM-binding protein YcdF (DUF218 family)
MSLICLQRTQPINAPQAVLVLGGDPARERFTAEFARRHPQLPIWVSGGSNPEYAEEVFRKAGIPEEQVHLDYAAIDTLTNFTTILDQFEAQGITHIYLITSDYHMRRARWIAQVILGSRGIDFDPVAIPSSLDSEPIETAIFDGGRALLWITTGKTGASLKSMIQLQGKNLADE